MSATSKISKNEIINTVIEQLQNSATQEGALAYLDGITGTEFAELKSRLRSILTHVFTFLVGHVRQVKPVPNARRIQIIKEYFARPSYSTAATTTAVITTTTPVTPAEIETPEECAVCKEALNAQAAWAFAMNVRTLANDSPITGSTHSRITEIILAFCDLNLGDRPQEPVPALSRADLIEFLGIRLRHTASLTTDQLIQYIHYYRVYSERCVSLEEIALKCSNLARLSLRSTYRIYDTLKKEHIRGPLTEEEIVRIVRAFSSVRSLRIDLDQEPLSMRVAEAFACCAPTLRKLKLYVGSIPSARFLLLLRQLRDLSISYNSPAPSDLCATVATLKGLRSLEFDAISSVEEISIAAEIEAEIATQDIDALSTHGELRNFAWSFAWNFEVRTHLFGRMMSDLALMRAVGCEILAHARLSKSEQAQLLAPLSRRFMPSYRSLPSAPIYPSAPEGLIGDLRALVAEVPQVIRELLFSYLHPQLLPIDALDPPLAQHILDQSLLFRESLSDKEIRDYMRDYESLGNKLTLLDLGKRCQHLKSLSIETFITDDGLVEYVKAFPKIVELKMFHCEPLTAQGVEVLSTLAQTLTHLSLLNICFRNVTALTSLRNLRSLILNGAIAHLPIQEIRLAPLHDLKKLRCIKTNCGTWEELHHLKAIVDERYLDECFGDQRPLFDRCCSLLSEETRRRLIDRLEQFNYGFLDEMELQKLVRTILIYAKLFLPMTAAHTRL